MLDQSSARWAEEPWLCVIFIVYSFNCDSFDCELWKLVICNLKNLAIKAWPTVTVWWILVVYKNGHGWHKHANIKNQHHLVRVWTSPEYQRNIHCIANLLCLCSYVCVCVFMCMHIAVRRPCDHRVCTSTLHHCKLRAYSNIGLCKLCFIFCLKCYAPIHLAFWSIISQCFAQYAWYFSHNSHKISGQYKVCDKIIKSYIYCSIAIISM